MSRFIIEQERFGSFDVTVLRDSITGACLRVAHLGAAILSWKIPHAGDVVDLLDGYQSPEELAQHKSARFAIMAPFANRIADARYRFEAEDFDLKPGAQGAEREIRHGFVRNEPFELVDCAGGDAHASVTLRTQHIRPGRHPGYPFAIDLTVTVTFDGHGFTLEADGTNVGERVAPYFFGFHPYFRLGAAGIADWTLELPAASVVQTDARLIPLAGDAAYASLDGCPELDFRRARPLGNTVIDSAYTRLPVDAAGQHHAVLRNPDNGLGLEIWTERGNLHAFTGDTVPRAPRTSVAIEPMECPTDAFNRDDCAKAIRLEPGATRRFRCGVRQC